MEPLSPSAEDRCTIRVIMKMRLVVAFLAMCCVVSDGQERRQAPPGATLTVEDRKVYKPGDTLKITLTLTPAPEGYGGGDVRVTIVNLEKSSQAKPNTVCEESTSYTSIPLKDKVSEYRLEFPIYPELKSGGWKVGSVEIGHAPLTRIEIRNELTFKIDTDEAPITVALSGPKTVVNGTTVKYHVTLDKPVLPPPSPGACADGLSVFFYPSGSDPKSEDRQVKGMQLKPDTLSYDVTFERLPDAQPIGQWTAEVRSSKGGHMRLCCPKPRALLGPNLLSFEVLPDPHLVVPTEAQVTLNPSEIDLLRMQAASLGHKIEGLQANLSRANEKQTRELLKRTIDDAIQNLEATKREFLSLEKSPIQQENSAVFFDDLRTSYREVETQLNAELQEPPAFVLVAGKKAAVPALAMPVLHVMQQNEIAFILAADNQSIYFDLKISSIPAGAKISYHRKGYPLQDAPEPTNCTIKSLVLAKWTIHVEEVGYDSVDREHDPYRDPDHSITVVLNKKK